MTPVQEQILAFMREGAYKPLSASELAQALAVPAEERPAFEELLAEMEADGLVVLTRVGRYGLPERMNLVVGRIQGHPRGFAFLIPDPPAAGDVFIGKENLGGAMHGDRAIARLVRGLRPDTRAEGEVIRILRRANQRVVGSFNAGRGTGFVTPDDRRLTDDIEVPPGAARGARDGDKVVVEITRWPEARRAPAGRVVERLGARGEPGVDILAIIRKHDLPEVFPPRVLQQAEAIPEAIPEAEYARRLDLRALPMVTIDGEDAKDLDDAVSVEKVGGLWRLGVHIADVSYYVAENSALDKEARARGTSVYLADRVVPMLPPKLSNNVCSLNPRVDRLTVSCLMDIDSAGRVVDYKLARTVICTNARMTYTKVARILLDNDPAVIDEYRDLVPVFGHMLELMRVLRARRQERGSLDFDLPEAKVLLDERGLPIEVRRYPRNVADQIIEEFMLAANETVAAHCNRLKLPFLYRIHEDPDPDRLKTLTEFLGLFGCLLRLPREGSVRPKDLQAVVRWVEGRREEHLINTILLRTMKQARYSNENRGHFGLAASDYCHFTSPIRRYPDLVIHRVIGELLDRGHLHPAKASRWTQLMPALASHTSERERAADEAERESTDLKKCEFMVDKVGEVFEGLISGVTAFGFFVALPNTIEGLVHISTLGDDYYHYYEHLYALVGQRTRRTHRLGDLVRVRLVRVDVDARQIDFGLEAKVAAEAPGVPVEVPATRSRAAKKGAQRSALGWAEAVDEAATAGRAARLEATRGPGGVRAARAKGRAPRRSKSR